MDIKATVDKIVGWLREELVKSGQTGFVVGLSGGVDSALVATLCAMTKKPTLLMLLPKAESNVEVSQSYMRALEFAGYLSAIHMNVSYETVNIKPVVDAFCQALDLNIYEIKRDKKRSGLVFANMCSRIRMTHLYAKANSLQRLVVGTGNKVEDFGVFFFTKYGDGGVDLSPIADLYKSDVREMAKCLGVPEEIYNAVPTDELWEDSRSDEEQLGVSYDDLEVVMKVLSGELLYRNNVKVFTRTLSRYLELQNKGRHKAKPIPVCKVRS